MNNITKGLALIVASTFPLWGPLVVNEVQEYQLSKMNKQEKITYFQNQLSSLREMVPPPKGCLAYSHAQSVNYCQTQISELTGQSNK